MNNNSLERRCSFNMSQGIPIAESTHLDGSGFPWGSTSPKVRSSSSFINSHSGSYLNDEINPNSKSMHLSKIDARVAADVQSKGLASRIVKYQESGTRLNRSISAHNLFCKPGQFPAVTLKKTNLPYRAAKRELSMIRIPPPDKSSFYGNTVSSLLRSSSVIGLQSKQNEDLSTENRPIIHPPPTENDMAPTRSVLDVLKEISRKRINSDDPESAETSKKYCSRARSDFVDIVSNKKSAVQENYLTSLSFPRQSYKRQRDCITSQQGIKYLETKTSPEQAKKRICNYNNDITSSLSSSIKCKKISTFQNVNQTLPTNFQFNETQNSKAQHKSINPKSSGETADMRFKNLENNRKKLEPCDNITLISKASVVNDQSNGAASQNSASEPFSNSDENVANDSIDTVHKPRLTLFNKQFDDDSESTDECKTHDLGENHKDDGTGIPFVKPKKIATNSGLRNPLIERTQKSKLALMLSGLRGELYQNPDLDELDSPCEKEKLKSARNKTNIFTSVSETTKSIPTLTTDTLTTTVTSSTNVETPTNVKTVLSSTTLSPLVGLKLKPSSENVSNMLSVENAKKTDLQSKSNMPVLGGFSFCTTSSSNTTPLQSCSDFKIESKSTPVKTSTNLITSTITTKPPSSLFSSNDEVNEISEKLQLPINKNLMQFPTICTAETLSTRNANTLSTSSPSPASSSCVSNLNDSTKPGSCTLPNNIFSVIPANSPVSVVSSAPIALSTSTVSPAEPILFSISTAKPVNSFNFSIPSTSSPISTASSSTPLMFNSANIANTISTSVSAVKSSSADHRTVGMETPFSLSSTGLLSFNTSHKSSNSEMEKYAGGEISTLSFNIDRNKAANSVEAFKTNTNTQNFKFDLKSHNSSDQNNQKAVSEDFNTSSSAQFDSQYLDTKAVESSISGFDNVARKLDSNIFNTSEISTIFGPNPIKAVTGVCGSNSNKSEGLVAPTGNDKINKSKSIPFSFVSNATTFAATSSNAGGFSFSSAVLKNNESGLSGQTDAPNHAFTSASTPQNNFMFASSNKLNPSNIFGIPTNKPENLSQGGFSFASLAPIKTSTAQTGFPLGSPADSKQNVLSINKPFSFAAPQPIQQKPSESSNIGSSLNIFGLTDTSKAAQNPSFNFTTGGLQSPNTFVSPSANVTTGPGDRPIRRATRRLQK